MSPYAAERRASGDVEVGVGQQATSGKTLGGHLGCYDAFMRVAGCAAFALVAVAVVSCAEVPVAKTRWDRAAKRFSRPPDDRANIYVYRDRSASAKVQLFLDGAPAGVLGSNSFTVLTVRPGTHSLFSGPARTNPPLVLNIQGGFNYYVSQGVKSGAMATGFLVGGAIGAAVAAGVSDAPSDLLLVDRAEGREAIRRCRLIAEVPPALPPLPRTAAPAASGEQHEEDRDLPPGW